MTDDLPRLRAFNVLAKEGSFSRAAKTLGLPRATLAQYIHDLEVNYGHMLIEQRQHPLQLTQIGRDILELTRRFVGAWDEIEARLRDAPYQHDRLVRIASDTPVHAVRLANALLRLEPETNLELEIASAPEVLARLSDFQADFAIVSDPQIDERFAYRPLFVDQLRIIVPRCHKRAEADTFPTKAIQGETLLLPEPSAKARKAIEAALASLEVLPKQTICLHTTSAILEAVSLNLGIGVLYASEFSVDPRMVSLPTDLGLSGNLTGYVVCRTKDRQSALMRSVYAASESVLDASTLKRAKGRSVQ